MKLRLYALLLCLPLWFPSTPLFAGWTSVSGNPANWVVAGSGSSMFSADASSIYASNDSGKTWTSTTNPGGSPFSALSLFNGQLWVGTTAQGALYSGNSGGAWTKSSIGTFDPFNKVYTYGQINDIAASPSSTTSLVSATALGAFLSSDGGATWTSSVQGLPVSGTCPFCVKQPVYALAGTASGILAGTDTGVYRSTDNGANWSAIGLSGSKVTKFSAGGSDVYAIADGIGLYKYASGAWTQLTGLSAVPTAVLAHPTKSGVVFAGTALGKVFSSTDGGTTWTDISDATLPAAKINALAVPANQADNLVAATARGIFAYGASVPKFSFAIAPISGVPQNTTIVSAEVTITGLTKAEPISITGGKYSLNGGPFTDQPGTISNGARLRVQVQSSGTPSTSTTATVTINSASASFVVTTLKIAVITNLNQVFVTPPPGAVINPDGTVSVTSTTPVTLQANLPSGTVIQVGSGTPLTSSAGTLTFTAQTTGATLTSINLNATTTGTQVVSGTFNVQSTAGNTIPVGNGSLTTTTCPTTMFVQNSGTQTSTFVQNCIVYFNPSGTVASANGFSATGTAVYGGETAEVSSGGSLNRIRIGSLAGNQGLPGDPITLANITSDSTIPKLEGNLQRLNNTASLLTVIQEALNGKFGVTTSQISYNSANGVVTYTVNGKIYRFVPIDVPTILTGGTVASAFAATNPATSASGAFSLAGRGIQVTMASSVGYFTDLDAAVKVVDPSGKIRLRSSGALQITLGGTDYVGVPGSNAIAGTLPSPGFQFDAGSGYYGFQDSTGAVQTLYPAFADASVADQAVKAADPSGSVSDNGNGTATMILLGGAYTLRPGYLLMPLPGAHANDLYWQDGAMLYLRFPDNTAQGFTL